MVSTQDGYTVLGRHSSNISEWISVHIGTYCIRMDNRFVTEKTFNLLQEIEIMLRKLAQGFNKPSKTVTIKH